MSSQVHMAGVKLPQNFQWQFYILHFICRKCIVFIDLGQAQA